MSIVSLVVLPGTVCCALWDYIEEFVSGGGTLLTYKVHQFKQAVVCGDEVSCGKPAPECFVRVAAEVGVQAADCLVIEDAPAGE